MTESQFKRGDSMLKPAQGAWRKTGVVCLPATYRPAISSALRGCHAVAPVMGRKEEWSG